MTSSAPALPTPLQFGEEITPTSHLTLVDVFLVAFGPPIDPRWLNTPASFGGAVYVASDGSQKLLQRASFVISNPLFQSQWSHLNWEDERDRLIAEKPTPDTWLLLWPTGVLPVTEIPQYLPYGPLTRKSVFSQVPVNSMPRCQELRDIVSDIAHGWDNLWNSRYIFHDHLRQVVVEWLIDGFLSHAESEIVRALAAENPAKNDDWKATLAALEITIKSICDVCAGDPHTWVRRLARNIDVLAFHTRLSAGEIPAVDTSTTPWSPGTTMAKAVIPSTLTDTDTDRATRRGLISDFHDANRTLMETALLKHYDEDRSEIAS